MLQLIRISRANRDIALVDDASSPEGTRWAMGTAASASAVLSYFVLTHVTGVTNILFGVWLQSGQQGRQPSPLACQAREPRLFPRPGERRPGPGVAGAPQGSRGFYVRAYRALLPPHAPDMLTVRIQVIDGTGTFTLSDCQPCRLLTLLHGHYSASSLLRARPTPSRLWPTSRFRRLYGLPCSGDFSLGRGGSLQLLSMSLSPCCRFHPAEVEMPHRSDFGTPCCLRPTEAGSALGSTPFEATFTFTVITARQLVVSPRETLSIGFRILISLHPAIQTTGRLTGLPPAEHTSLNWTHIRTAGFPQAE